MGQQTRNQAVGPAPSQTARRIEVFGTVQGVGFRPFVHRLASGLGLDGWVSNVDGHVEVVAAGRTELIEAFVERLRRQAPVLAAIRYVRVSGFDGLAPAHGSGFAVYGSTAANGTPSRREIPPDAATCEACVRELFDPHDRRYRYPFINCTDCGPRATVIIDLPYDRERTTMRTFELCPDCAAEYHDPTNRRFHAEPLACPRCGPQLAWERGGGPAAAMPPAGEDALRAAIDTIAGGGIVALKGLGGYQLVCTATAEPTVAELRRRKMRPGKPFAVMVPDLDAVRRLAHTTATERAVMSSPAHPVVLVAARQGESVIAEGVHPGTDRIGLFLPTTPLHHLILRELDTPLIVTSGNRADEPIAIDDDEARRNLAEVADGFLTHNRPIRSRYDDSVVRSVGRCLLTVRRARGYAPAQLRLPARTSAPLVAAGAQLKHTFTLADGGRAVLGPHTGDLEDASTLEAFEGNYAELRNLTGIEPHVVVHDLHPGYLSTQWAERWPAKHRIPVQHHHAHVAACAAEHGVRGPFIGVAYDGLGLGDDGTLWGGEILAANLASYRRVGRFGTAPLPGGAAAVRHPARMALGYLFGAEALGVAAPSPWLSQQFIGRLDPREVSVVRTMIGRGINCPRASSTGRLFDAVGSLLGLCDDASYEGEGAVAVETAAGDLRADPLEWRLVNANGLWIYDPAPTLTALLEGVAAGVPVARLAAAFHATLAVVTAALVEHAVTATGTRTVCLSGGCFQNRRLLSDVRRHLRAQGLRVLVGSAVPVNDGGISYGQAAVAAARSRER